MSGLFAVSNFAITTASAGSANEARTRALALYRKFQKSVCIDPHYLYFYKKKNYGKWPHSG
jgi:hypothetical protein